MRNKFFEESLEQSIIKAEIVSKYFWAWAKVILGAKKKFHGVSSACIAYIDLFAGPGRYKDGASSTPIKILETAIEDPEIRDSLVTIFNDKDPDNVKSLQTEISKIPEIKLLKHKPIIMNEEVGEEIIKLFEEHKLIPSLCFIDPWGYKGLSLQLIDSVLKDWGCDCIFFFNYNRINMGLSNSLVKEHMNLLFGEERALKLRIKLEKMNPSERELEIVNELSLALKETKANFVLPFCFKNESGTRSIHHLFFTSKDVKGYEIMKEIMAKYSSTHEQGVPSFTYNQADERYPFLFELNRPLDDLADMLLDKFAGKEMPMKAIYEAHHIGRRYIKKNYKSVLTKLESEGKVTTDKPERRKDTFSDTIMVNFPPKR